jgi:uncharacterized protein DUF2842
MPRVLTGTGAALQPPSMPQPGTVMTQSTRKLLGTVLTLVVLVLYIWLATLVYEAFLTGAPPFSLLAYFIVAGLLWAAPVSFIIRWMAKPDVAKTR